jgi:hypothetical protein
MPRALLDAGADCLTLGDHAFDQKDMLSFIEGEPRILRPLNIAREAPGRGAGVFDVPAAGGAFWLRRCWAGYSCASPSTIRSRPSTGCCAPIRGVARCRRRFVDFHAEATSEKMAMGHFCDGRASAVVGTHTHVPTADAQVLPGGTGYLTDAGMCGDYHSVIGMEPAEPMRRFVGGLSKGPFRAGAGPGHAVGRADRDRRRDGPRHGRSIRCGTAVCWQVRRAAMNGPLAGRLAPFAVLAVCGAGWGLSQPLGKIAMSTGHGAFGVMVWQLAVGVRSAGGVHRPARPTVAGWAGRSAALSGHCADRLGAARAASLQAVRLLPSGVVSILISMVPIFALPIALAWRLERFAAMRLLGVPAGRRGGGADRGAREPACPTGRWRHSCRSP